MKRLSSVISLPPPTIQLAEVRIRVRKSEDTIRVSRGSYSLLLGGPAADPLTHAVAVVLQLPAEALAIVKRGLRVDQRHLCLGVAALEPVILLLHFSQTSHQALSSLR